MSDTETVNESAPRRTRSGGRDARQKSRGGQAAPAYIKRLIPPYEMLSEDGLVALENEADRLLEEIGFEIRGDDEAIALFKNAGASVDGQRMRFPRGLIRSIIQKTTPREFIQHARNPARSVVIGGNNTVFSPAYGSPFVTDIDKGRRYGTIEDFQNFIKLAYSTPYLHHSGGTVCEPVDLPVNKRHLEMVYSHIK